MEETQDIRTFIARIDTHGCKAVGIYKDRGIYGQWGAQHGPPTTEVRGNSQTVCQPCGRFMALGQAKGCKNPV